MSVSGRSKIQRSPEKREYLLFNFCAIVNGENPPMVRVVKGQFTPVISWTIAIAISWLLFFLWRESQSQRSGGSRIFPRGSANPKSGINF